jgi:hypothetical protein
VALPNLPDSFNGEAQTLLILSTVVLMKQNLHPQATVMYKNNLCSYDLCFFFFKQGAAPKGLEALY